MIQLTIKKAAAEKTAVTTAKAAWLSKVICFVLCAAMAAATGLAALTAGSTRVEAAESAEEGKTMPTELEQFIADWGEPAVGLGGKTEYTIDFEDYDEGTDFSQLDDLLEDWSINNATGDHITKVASNGTNKYLEFAPFAQMYLSEGITNKYVYSCDFKAPENQGFGIFFRSSDDIGINPFFEDDQSGLGIMGLGPAGVYIIPNGKTVKIYVKYYDERKPSDAGGKYLNNKSISFKSPASFTEDFQRVSIADYGTGAKVFINGALLATLEYSELVDGYDELDLNWQRLILTHLAEKEHLGVLTGAPLTDVRITLTAGRAHLKHTEGGDFRQATYRAVRQGLMKAQSVLLEPLYRFRLEVPLAQTGRAISDLRAMHGDFTAESGETAAVLEGTAPVICLRDYAAQVAAYTAGRGKLSCIAAGYAPCHNAEEVIAAAAYDPEADPENSPDSVFCAHGAGTVIKWDRVDEYCHVGSGLRVGQERRAPRPRMGSLSIDERELEAIMEREFGPIKRPMYTKAAGLDAVQKKPAFRQKKELVIIDGYNVIFAWDELKTIAGDSLDAARTRLGEILVNYRGFTGSDVVLVFDGYAVKGNPGEKVELPGVRVVYTKENESADIYIEKLLHDIGRNDAVRVVTSDNLIRLSALGSGILRTSAREFGNEMDWVMGQIGDVLRRSAERSHTVKAGEGKL